MTADTPLPTATTPPMSDADYRAQLAALDAERAALTAAYITSQTYPRWAYHATEPPQIVDSDAEALALGPGWSPTPVTPPPAPPVVTALDPDTVLLGAPSFTLHVIGTGFAPGAVIVFAGYDEPTTVIDDTVVTTGVNMDVWLGADTVAVAVRSADGARSNALPFTFTEAAP